MITISFMNLNLFNSNFTIVKCILKNRYKIKIMIDNDSDDYEFINFVIAYEICEILECAFVKLMKYCMIKKYNEKTNSFITHAIYFRMKINDHTKNFAALMITLLINHSMILRRPWMIKHEIIIDVAVKQYDKKIIKWRKNHCDHLKIFDHLFLIVSSADLNINTNENSFAWISTKILRRNSNFRFWKKKFEQNQNVHVFCVLKKSNSKISIVWNWKEFEKKKRIIDKSWQKNKNSLNIAIITIASFNVLIKQKNVKIFAIFLKNINYKIKKNRDKF